MIESPRLADMPKGQIRRVVYQQDGVPARIIRMLLCGLGVAFVRPIVGALLASADRVAGRVPVGDPTAFLAPFQPALWVLAALVCVIFPAITLWRAEQVVNHLYRKPGSEDQ